MRNIDQIKALKYEMGRYIKKVKDQEKEIALLREDRQQAEHGVRELSKTVDAICIALALEFGRDTGDGAREITIPRVDVLTLHESYCIEAEQLDGGEYVVSVVEREVCDAKDGEVDNPQPVAEL